MTPKIGDLYRVSPGPTMRDEISEKRPVVILNAGHANHLRLAIVLPVAGWKALWKDHPFFVPLEPTPLNGLERKSAVDCFQMRVIGHERLIERIGKVSDEDLDQVKQALALILDIDPEQCQ